MKVLILTEGGKEIGFGHVTRMYAICQAFEEVGVRPYMIIKGDASIGSVLGDANWDIFDWISDPSGVKDRFGGVDILLIDSYLAPREVYEYLSKMAKVPAYYDDFGGIEYPCGVVINGNIHAELIDYPESACVRYLRGVKYLPMRKEFWEVEDKEISNELSSVLVTFGGEDLRGMTPLVLSILTKHFKDYRKFVVIGKGFKEDTIKEVEALSDSRTELVFHPNAGKMKELMLKADIAISAAGQTLYELARVGVPTVGVVVADNQELQAQVFKDKGFLADLLYWNDKRSELKLEESICRLEQYEIRARLSSIGKLLVDGKGVRRITSNLVIKLNTNK
ncbi:glycosyltransferase [Hydrogenivirga sp. 128-5-R1-1]|uniref:PseG/SpsG family protein n=1 Tax=Hydrogenivirga sp. 128-5-R1-1 TaxID=392423 RepID=UPI00015EF86D|nr:glycosyltransferase [Hydrogenivirga sp. 128-5-R1-1]EDP74909.1 glycosyltransferase [Hydrogenivirga sp. 128-5-R1-1]